MTRHQRLRRAITHLRPFGAGLACLLGMLGLNGCGADDVAEGDSVTVGLLLPFTGSDSATSSNFERAVLFARDQVNAGGGVGGRKLRVVSADTHSDLSRAEASARHLVDAGAAVVIGPESTEVAEGIKPLLDEQDVVLLSPLVGAANDRDIPCDKAWFRLAPSARVLGEALAKRMIADDLRRAAVLGSDGAYDGALAEAFAERLVSLQGEVAYRGTLSRNAPSYAKDIELALEQDVDAILIAASSLSASLVVNELGVLSSKRPQIYLSPPLKTEVLLQNVTPELLNGALGVTPRIFDASTDFPMAFSERWAGDEPLDGAYFYYDALALVAFALERALQADGELDSEAIRSAILDVSNGPGEAAGWNELPSYLPRLREGDEVYYTGLSGPMLLKPCGDRQVGASSVWTVTDGQITAE